VLSSSLCLRPQINELAQLPFPSFPPGNDRLYSSEADCPQLIVGIERFGMLQKSHALLSGPAARGRGNHTERPGIEGRELNAPALFVGFVPIEGH
jgi:hypothetical protein